MIEIKHRYTGDVICSFNVPTLKDAVVNAVKEKAYLRWADLGGEYLSESYMAIGCQSHTHDEWKSFYDAAIADMASNASEFWKQNETRLLYACKAHRKESLAYRKDHPEQVAA